VKDSVNEVLFSEGLRRRLELAEGHEMYYRLLKAYQRAICLLRIDTFEELTNVCDGRIDCTLKIASSIAALYLSLTNTEAAFREGYAWEMIS
jgi:hypothetical protein